MTIFHAPYWRSAANGDTVFQGRIGYPVIPIDAAVLSTAAGRIVEGLARRTMTTSEVTRALALLDLPRGLPPVTEIMTGQDGTIWLRRQDSAMDGRRWDVYDNAGDPVGYVNVPLDVTLIAANGPTVVGMSRNEFDTEQLIVFRRPGR